MLQILIDQSLRNHDCLALKHCRELRHMATPDSNGETGNVSSKISKDLWDLLK